MANTKLIFCGTERSKTEEHELVCYFNNFNEIFIEIDCLDGGDIPAYICLDKSTAIKLAKTLRTHINFISEEV
jgi:hypothetical protein